MMVPQKLVNAFIKEYKGASVQELKANLKRLQKKSPTMNVVAEIKAIQALLA